MKVRIFFLTVFLISMHLSGCGKSDKKATAQIPDHKTSEDSGEKALAQTAIPKTPGDTSKNIPTSEVKMWYDDWNDGMERAMIDQKPVYVHFTADWCGWCRKMEKESYADPAIHKRFEDEWITLKIDTDAKNKSGNIYTNKNEKVAYGYLKGEKNNFEAHTLTNNQLFRAAGGKGLPTLLFIDKNGKLLDSISSYIPKEDFGIILDFFQEEAYKNTSFEAYKNSSQREGS